jgi:metal-sulfur cluster biosynthetic enzyme
VRKVVVEQTWYPEWNSNLISEEGRKKLGIWEAGCRVPEVRCPMSDVRLQTSDLKKLFMLSTVI